MILDEQTAASRAARPAGAPPLTSIVFYGCGPDEAAAFRAAAPRFGIAPRLTEQPLSESTAALAEGSRSISVDHRTPIPHTTIRLLAEAGIDYVSTRSAGSDHIDVDFARRLGVTVEGVAYSPGSVADYTLMLMLMAVRDARSTVLRAEAHDYRLNAVRGRELGELTVGVIGTGRIGAAVVDRLRGFGSRVLAWDRTPKTSAEHVGLDELLGRSDVVTLHTPLTAATRHLLNRDRIARMRPGAIVVNTGRGALVDTAALVDALEDGRLGGAALDVVEGESAFFARDPAADPEPGAVGDPLFRRLRRLPNVLLTPHTAYFTDRALQDTVDNTLINCLEFERRHP